MPTLTDSQIIELVETGEIEIEPFDRDNVEPASIDLTLGGEAFRASDDDKIILDEGSVLTLPPGEMALVLTRERVKLTDQYTGIIGLRSKFARKGVDLFAGPQFDPGFEGPLHIVLINLSPSQQIIEYGETFLTLELRKLTQPADNSYVGEYQAQSSITSDEIRDLKKGEGLALSEAVQAMRNIAQDIGALEESVSSLTNNVDLYMRIFVVTIVVLVAGILGALLYVIL